GAGPKKKRRRHDQCRRHNHSPLGGEELHCPLTAASRELILQTGAYASSVSHRRSRSEEHTSELQSLTNLVCRLLLETRAAGMPTLPAPMVSPGLSGGESGKPGSAILF